MVRNGARRAGDEFAAFLLPFVVNIKQTLDQNGSYRVLKASQTPDHTDIDQDQALLWFKSMLELEWAFSSDQTKVPLPHWSDSEMKVTEIWFFSKIEREVLSISFMRKAISKR